MLALLTTIAVHVALERMRADRRRLELLIAATAKLDTSLDPQQTLRRIAAMALPELAELCVIDLVDDDGAITTTVAAGVDPEVAERVEGMRPEERPRRLAGLPVARALRERTSHVVADVAGSTAAASGEAITTASVLSATDEQSRSATVVPMVARGRLLGVMSFVHAGAPQRGQLRVLEDLTGRAALAFDNARLYAERARVAQTLRRSLMPGALPKVPGLELDCFFRPMGAGSEVGGDFYDVFADSDGCWLVVGDVCGKGAEAAVLTAFLRHTTVAYAREGERPAKVLERVNSAMIEQDFGGRFATAILARLDFAPEGVALTVAAGGHPPALVSRAGGGSEELGIGGTLLGIFEDAASARTRLCCGSATRSRSTPTVSPRRTRRRGCSRARSCRRRWWNAPRSRPRARSRRCSGSWTSSQGARDDIAILAVRIAAVQARGVRAA